jgi:hypothetical protein
VVLHLYQNNVRGKGETAPFGGDADESWAGTGNQASSYLAANLC